ncbi:hypothetical protein [Myceligenerans crystallogenes]|uniref:Uncharacterized protein n=1 Tax=Myceligenerans crystallogenes TaxID=316335 RepID=A0ABN2N6X1_9MICO
MRARLFWVGVGVVVTVVVIRRGRRLAEQYTPANLAARAGARAVDAADAGAVRLARGARGFAGDFRRARAAREAELMRSLLSDGAGGTYDLDDLRRRTGR